MGIPISNEHSFTVSFTDDQVVIAQDAYDLEFMLNRLYKSYDKSNLKVHLDKTEYLAGNQMLDSRSWLKLKD